MPSSQRFAIFLLLVLISYSFAGQAQSSSLSPMDRLENQFNNYELAGIQLKSFDKRAQQKLIDLADYLNIIHNPKYDQELRDQAQNMLTELFVDHAKIPSLFKEKGVVSIQAIEEHSSFIQKGDFYQKELTFNWQETSSKGKLVVKKMKAVVILKQVKQQFGKRKDVIWKVLLSEVSEL